VIDPCGSVVDFLRSPHRTSVRFVEDGEPVTIRWYRAKTDARLIPFPTIYGSQVWESDAVLSPHIGPVSRDFDYVRNVDLNYRGKCVQGHPEWFREGLSASEFADAIANPSPRWCCSSVIHGRTRVTCATRKVAVIRQGTAALVNTAGDITTTG
jgi:hypothetical protein